MPKLSEADPFTDSELPSGSYVAVAVPDGNGNFIIYKVSPSIIGATGPQGATGAQGNVIRSGVGAPVDSVGIDGDYWLNTANSDYYQKTGGVYNLILNLKGADGADGSDGAQGIQGIQGIQGPVGPAASPGGADTNVQFNNSGALGGDANFTYDGDEVVAKNYRVTPAVLTYAASVAIDFSSNGFRTLALTGNVTFTTSNRASGRMVAVKISADGSLRTLTFPAGWTFVGSKPTDIAANKDAVLSVTCFGTADTDVLAAYSVEE
jgi:hypothetical protein